MELLVTLLLGVALWLLGLYLNRSAHQRHMQRLDAQDITALQRDLDVLQLLQKHRALGAQQAASAEPQRREVAARLDTLWAARRCTEGGLCEPGDWPALKQAPADFERHCAVIESLLCDVHLLELQLAGRGRLNVRGIGDACRALEDLGRLRGLAVRAAHHLRCPLDLQIQMRYLCQRIRGHAGHGDLDGLLEQLDLQLISAAAVALQPADCFALITPIIDARLNGIRQCLA